VTTYKLSSPRLETLDFRLLIDSTPGLIHTSLPDGYLDFFNQTWLTYVGRPLEDVQGWKWTTCIHPDDVEVIVQKWRACLASGEPFLHEARVRRADGEYRWMLHHKVALRNGRGEIVKWYGSSVDIEERKRAEEKLQAAMSERARLAAVRAEIGMALARKESLEGVLDSCAKALVRYLDAAFARIWTLSLDGRELELRASAGLYTRLDGHYSRIPFGKFKIGSIAQARKPHVTNDVQNDPRVDNHEWARAEKMTSFAGYPLVVEDRVVGVMGMFSRKALNQGTIETLSFIADGIAQSIERKHAEDGLRRSEFYLAEAQRISHTGSWVLNTSGFFEHWSRELFRIYGLNPRNGTPTLEQYLAAVHPQDRELVSASIRRMREQGSGCDVKKRIIRPDGVVRHIRCVGIPVVDDGLLKLFGTAVDVTEQEELTQELQRRDAYSAEAQELSHTGSFGWKPDSGEIVWSDETYRIFEYERDIKLTIERIAQRVHPEDRAGFQKVIDAASGGTTHLEHTYRLLLPEGRIKYVHALAHTLRDASGNREFVGAATDITSIKRAEKKLRASEAEVRRVLAELRQVVDLIPQHIVVLDVGGNAIFANEQVLEYTGLTIDEVRAGSFRERAFHPEDVERLRDERQKALSGTAPFENEQRVLGKDGKYRWFLIRYNPLIDGGGDTVRWYCGATEITERKEAEEKLWHVIDTIPTLAWSMLPDGTNEFLSKNWHDYTGLSAEESHGWGWQAAFHSEDLPPLMERWRGMLVSGEPGEIEARLRRHDGVYRWFLIRAQPFRDEAGKIVRWYGTSTDIEDRKQAEDRHRQGERELRQLANMLPQCVVVLDKQGRLLQANKTMLDYYGQTLEAIIGSGNDNPLRRYLHPDDLERVQCERGIALSGEVPFESEMRLLGKDGRHRWFLFRYRPVVSLEGNVVRWIATATDIDERKHVEERTRNENLALREQIDRDSMFENIVGSSEALRKVLRQVTKVAPSDSTVLILGETGTGKELVARAIHKRSGRSERAFIGVNCAAIPPSLIASELFGHEKGAFTGATQRRVGRFESASGGTIFLDEVGDLPPEIQIALLRVLQEHEIERVGSNKAIAVDVRVLAATHRDLDTLVAEGKFREDLLYRLNVVPIQMPALRERADDIPVLVDYFISRFEKKAGKKFKTIDKKTTELFKAYLWPGNVRELQNVIERAVILSEEDAFCVDETWFTRQAPQAHGSTVALTNALQQQEKEMIEAALAESGGRVSGPGGAATRLGIPRPTLDAKIKRLGINKYHFKGTSA
jgi:formate hydrogenlyase transcriptional activator